MIHKIFNLQTSEKRDVKFFKDDSIENVRQQIAKSVDIHHDRLFILVGIKLSRHYYKQDKRNWESLFHRISYNGMPIEKEPFESYITEYRIPKQTIKYEKIDLDEWMTYPEYLQELWDPSGEFTEFRIFGVEEIKSYCLPFNINLSIVNKIQSAQYPIPDNHKLFNSFYDEITEFLIKEYEEGPENVYFPFFTTRTPKNLTNMQINLLDSNYKHLEDILSLNPPVPKEINILKIIWFVELVDTQLEEHVRTRFEQMFYGLTVSEKIPCITFFTNRNEISRHKFYTNDIKTKKAFIDISMWSAWWSKSKPPRNRPTLVLYRGKTRHNYDRISISSSDITFAIYRESGEKYNIEELRLSIEKWFKSLDSIFPFFEESDIVKCRWKLQDINFEAIYKNDLLELDTRRLNCLSSIFDKHKKEHTLFKFLRTDYALDDLSSSELHVIDMLKDNPYLKYIDVEKELKISSEDSIKLLNSIKIKVEEDPRILERKQRGFPIVQFLPSSVIVSSIRDIDLTLQYVNILRYILSNPSSKNLDKICPKKMEEVSEKVVVSNVSFEIDENFGDLFNYAETNEIIEDVINKELPKSTKKGTTYDYFFGLLQKFDPITYNFSKGSSYKKDCEQSRQPIPLSKEKLEELPKEYDPRTYLSESEILETKEPDGILTCPEYWCMYDKLPLQETQLIKKNGILSCPLCGGKLRHPIKDSKADIREFSVFQKPKNFKYPKDSGIISPENQKDLPCCFKTPKKEKTISKEINEYKYYVLGETATQLKTLRFAYLSPNIISKLQIKENYKLIVNSNNRIQDGLSGFFRVGLQRPSESLPELFNENVKISLPHENVSITLQCSFLHTWKILSSDNLEIIETQLKSLSPFDKDDLARINMSKIISGISNAFQNRTLTQLEELEYVGLIMGIDIFHIHTKNETLSCFYESDKVRLGKKGLIILQTGNEIDCISHIFRRKRDFEYRANIYKSPFEKSTYEILDKLKEKACEDINIPHFHNAVDIVNMISPDKIEEKFILDPFGRVQGLYVENKYILPFKNTFVSPEFLQNIQSITYSELKQIPDIETQKYYLNIAKNKNKGYEFDREIHDIDGNIVELLLKSGLRVPVKPEKSQGVPEDVLNTVMKEGETELTFGLKNEEDFEKYRKISYNSEVLNFLIFQLTKDLEDDYIELKNSLMKINPLRKEVEPYLEKWLDKVTYFNNITKPIEFLSKIRKPCGQLKQKRVCEESHMCGWTENTCRIQIRDTISKPKLFNKLLNILLENSKIRYMILDGRTTPFFSTILYLELPNEIILTDLELKKTSED
jgi:hypothetical protein